MDDARRALLGDPLQQRVVHLVHCRQLAGLLLVPLPVPPLELAGDVPLVLAQAVEAGGLQVDGVDGRHRVDDALAGAASRIDGQQRLGGRTVAHDVAVDERHHVERRTVDVRVVAEPEGRSDGHGRRLQAADDPVLASHVVGAGEHVAERRAAQHEPRAVGAGDAEGEVGVPAGDEVEGERGDRATDVRNEPLGDRRDVDAGQLAHVSPPYRHCSGGTRSGPGPSPSPSPGPAVVTRRYRSTHGHRCHRRNVPDRGRRPFARHRGARRPVGAVVRPVSHARPDPGEGHRRHRRQGRAGEGQRGREPGHLPGVPGAVDPGRLRAQGRPGGRRVRRRAARARRAGVRRRVDAVRGGADAGDAHRRGHRGLVPCCAGARARQRGRRDRSRRAARRSRPVGGSAGLPRSHPRERPHPPRRRHGTARPGADRARRRSRRDADGAAAERQARRGGSPAVRRPAGADGR